MDEKSPQPAGNPGKLGAFCYVLRVIRAVRDTVAVSVRQGGLVFSRWPGRRHQRADSAFGRSMASQRRPTKTGRHSISDIQ